MNDDKQQHPKHRARRGKFLTLKSVEATESETLNIGERLSQAAFGRSMTPAEGLNVIENMKNMSAAERRFVKGLLEP